METTDTSGEKTKKLSPWLDQYLARLCLWLGVAGLCVKILSGSEALGLSAFALVLFAAALYALQRVAAESDRPFLLKLFLAGLGIRLLTAFILFAVRLPIEPDAIGYDRIGWKIAQAWQVNGLGFAPEAGVPYDPGYYYLHGLVYRLLGHQPVAMSILNAFIGAFLAVPVFLWAKLAFKNKLVARWGSIGVAFWPALVYWTARDLKDGIILFLLAWTMLAIHRVSTAPTRRELAWIVAALALLGLFRLLYMFALFAIAVVGLAIWLANKLPRLVLVTSLVVCGVVGMGMLQVIFTHQYSVTRGNAPTLESVVAHRNSGASGNSALPEMEPSWQGVLSYMPVGLAYYFGGPFPSLTPATVYQAFAVPEMLGWYVAAPFTLAGFYQYLRRRRTGALYFTYLAVFALGTTFEVANMGTMYRMRAAVWIFSFAFSAAGLYAFLVRFRVGHFKPGLEPS